MSDYDELTKKHEEREPKDKKPVDGGNEDVDVDIDITYGAGFARLQNEKKVEPGEISENIQDEEHIHIHDITFNELRRLHPKFWFGLAMFSLLAFSVILICLFTVTFKRELKFEANVILNETYREEIYGDRSSYEYEYIRSITLESFTAVLDDAGINYKTINWIDLNEDPGGIIIRAYISVIVNKPVAQHAGTQEDKATQIYNAVNEGLSSTVLGSLGTIQFWINSRNPPEASLECPSDTTLPTDVGGQNATIDSSSLPQPQVQEINREIPWARRLIGSDDPGEVFPLGVTTIRYRVIYTTITNGGAMAQCEFNINIQDQESPIILCPDDIRRTSSNQVIWSPPVVYDNVSRLEDIIVVSNPGNATVIDMGVRVVYQVRDQAGNEASCHFTVNV